MKWVRTREQIQQEKLKVEQARKERQLNSAKINSYDDSAVAVSEEEIDNSVCYKEYENDAALQEAVKKEYGEWARYSFKVELDQAARERYELFCGGYLQFYDDIVRNGSEDHYLYLQWDKKNVTIHIHPAPRTRTLHNSNDLTKNKILLSATADTLTKDPPPPPAPPPPSIS